MSARSWITLAGVAVAAWFVYSSTKIGVVNSLEGFGALFVLIIAFILWGLYEHGKNVSREQYRQRVRAEARRRNRR